VILALICLTHRAPAQELTPSSTGLKPEVLLLARIKVHMEKVLLKQPNYTCVETIERSRRQAPSRRYRLQDTVRLEVALVNGAEMFSWPGESEFRSSNVGDVVTTGAIGSGNFAAHARSTFISNTATFTYAGKEQIEARELERFDYRVPLSLSGYTVKMATRKAIVPYHGSIWVDPETLDLVRLDVHADMIPPSLGLTGVETELWYGRTRIGDSDFLLPRLGITTLTHLSSDESRNEITFSECRQYSGESVLSFEAPDTALAGPARPLDIITLPEGVEFEVALETGIEAGRTAVGDEVRARVQKDAKLKKQVVVPKGALVTGRVRHLEKIGKGYPYFIVAVQFDRIEYENWRAEITPKLQRFNSYLGGGGRATRDPSALYPRGGVDIVTLPHLEFIPGVGVFYVKGGKLIIPAGSRMTWETAKKTNGDEK
jgi:hypothetical protein